jgi:hypothetical protein
MATGMMNIKARERVNFGTAYRGQLIDKGPYKDNEHRKAECKHAPHPWQESACIPSECNDRPP